MLLGNRQRLGLVFPGCTRTRTRTRTLSHTHRLEEVVQAPAFTNCSEACVIKLLSDALAHRQGAETLVINAALAWLQAGV